MAAQAALPLKSEDLLELLTDLVRDPEAAVREAAQASLAGFPSAELLPLLKHRQDPGHGPRGRRIDGPDVGVGMRRAHEHRIGLAREA